jgi:starch-binding outer membrane protein, SusD/RagB family
MRKFLILLPIILCAYLSSCRGYVEVDQPGVRTLKYTSDFQYILNNINIFEYAYSLPLLSSDDIDINSTTILNNLTDDNKQVYTWSEYFYTSSQTDVNWTNLYNQIYNCNVITDKVLASEQGTDAEKKAIYAEALVQRSYAYLTLMNMYSPIYQESTADVTLGVPLLLTPDLYASLNRPTARVVYNQIINDIREALPNLPVTPTNIIHPGQTAAYALLARTYLYMQKYDSAGVNAQKALDRQSTLLDLRTLTTGTLPTRLNDPEIILSKVASFYTTLPLSSNLINLFSTTDLRYSLYTRDGTGLYPSFTGRAFYRNEWTGEDINVGLSVSEMMLIKAESLVRKGQYSSGIQVLNDLRKMRFATADYVDLSAQSTSEALKIVIEERRRELVGRGMRWFDQRRLSSETGLVDTVQRVVSGVTYTLAPMSNRYTFPISAKVIDLNPEIEQNPR